MSIRARALSLGALTLALLSAACYHAVPIAGSPDAGVARYEATDDDYVAAPSDSCQRAQQRAERAPVFRVMHEPKPYRTNKPPAYPLRERHSGQQRTTARFLLSPAGRVDMSSVTFHSSSGPKFDEAVLAVLPEWRFTPAELVPGCRVWFRVTMPIMFYTAPMAGTR